MVDHPAWKTFFKSLRPSYTLPSRKVVATKLLDEKFDNMQTSLESNLEKSSNMHLQCDGWSNIRNEAIINFIITTPEPVFVKYLDTKENRHTAEYLCQEIIQVLEKYGVLKFLCLIGDNAANVQKAFSLVNEKYPHLIPLGCLAHSLHLLCADILKTESIRKFMSNVIEMIKKIKGIQVLNAMFSSICKEKNCAASLKLPAVTRWGSALLCLASMKKLKIPLQQLAVKEEAQGILPDHMKKQILDDDIFWIKVDKFIQLLDPIIKWINILQGNTGLIHRVHTAVSEIKNCLTIYLPESPMSRREEKLIAAAFENRKGSILQPIHSAAAILDPNNQGFRLSQNEQIVGLEFINTLASSMNLEIVSELINYRIKKDFWEKSFLWSCAPKTEPIAWWKAFCSNTNLSAVAIKILSAPVSSAETERSFSKFSFIHNKKRNKLTTERAGKITYIAFNWQLSQSVKEPEDNNINVSGASTTSDAVTYPEPKQTVVELNCDTDETDSNISLAECEIDDDDDDEISSSCDESDSE